MSYEKFGNKYNPFTIKEFAYSEVRVVYFVRSEVNKTT